MGPDYNRPDVALSARFVGGDATSVGAVATEPWWQSYRDPLLNDLVTRGLAQNLDVIAATERIGEAAAALRATGGNAALSGGLDVNSTRSGGDGIATTTTDTAQLGAAFVFDLFGGIRRERGGAEADLVSARAEVETTRLAWLAELVAAYSDARYYQEALALARQTVSAREETVAITRDQVAAGAATDYERAEAEALLETARAAVPQYAAGFDANVFAIATLLNEPAGPIRASMQRGAPQLRPPPGSKTGVPADLLRNRPDIRSAEADLASAVAGVGMAEADLYPALTLSGTISRTDGTGAWSFGPGLSLPLFNQGALRASRDAAASRARQAEIAWRAAILAAVEDVQVSQSNLSRYRQRAAALRRAAAKYGEALTLAQDNYRNGASTLLDLLETDRNTASARISAASAVNDAAKAWATLKIATGAGAAYAAGRAE
ncbi:RND efflux system, outer membrane lipoprotein CmeC (plasmid) [Rhodovulum sp. P5]|nr:RND efflux system, outer membrane lipoprotein CmeC [Rhodovulum sp. P5]